MSFGGFWTWIEYIRRISKIQLNFSVQTKRRRKRKKKAIVYCSIQVVFGCVLCVRISSEVLSAILNQNNEQQRRGSEKYPNWTRCFRRRRRYAVPYFKIFFFKSRACIHTHTHKERTAQIIYFYIELCQFNSLAWLFFFFAEKPNNESSQIKTHEIPRRIKRMHVCAVGFVTLCIFKVLRTR